MLRQMFEPIVRAWDKYNLPSRAKAELHIDNQGLPSHDPGAEIAIKESIAWLKRAHDQTASHDRGVARDYSLLTGWATSYPETTGYIIPTMISYSKWANDADCRLRAKQMLDWCVEIQLDGGGFQGGRIDATPVVPVTFNTGQILLGLAAGVAEFGDIYRPAMRSAADWLKDSLDSDGCWRKHPTPFAEPGEKAYETHVAWGLLEAARQDADRGYAEAGLKNVDWALSKQHENGWFEDCCLNEPIRPLTHTIGYVLRGVVEAHIFSGDEVYLNAARRTADALVKIVDSEGYLPGRIYADWKPAVDWVCLTGSVQIAHCLLLLYQASGDHLYRDAAFALNRYVRRTIKLDGAEEIRGGVKGAFPVDGDYGSYELLNWSAKFFVDSNMLELDIRNSASNSNSK